MRRQKKDAATFVRDQRIAKIGAAEIVEAHADGVGDDETIDAAGPAIMPGIVDCHVHPWYGGITSFEELDFRPGVAYRARRATHGPKQVLRAGAQQSPRLAGSGISNVARRGAVDAGPIEGPRIAAGGHDLST